MFGRRIAAVAAFILVSALSVMAADRADALTPYQQDVVVDTAFSYEGYPYGHGYYGIDCTELTQTSYAAAGIGLSANPVAQYYESYPVAYPAPGDLVFYDSYLDGGIDHVGIYTGQGMVIDANAYWGAVIYHEVTDIPGFVSYGRM